jgi:hypothetical protein
MTEFISGFAGASLTCSDADLIVLVVVLTVVKVLGTEYALADGMIPAMPIKSAICLLHSSSGSTRN